ncbi:recombination repair protein 1 isoform X2 [Drosophila eugracilis]|uniref:recombination repair protein 1 isoform X2 n=1 Tax=Drosophila eugracilis TaxID=29029 RepID=UPI001BD926F6|nr:recombination repair protein 1 isoform X2 [Drosophila eugracilis]
MPRAKAVKKETVAIVVEPSDTTPNGNESAADENPAANSASVAEGAKVPSRGKPRVKKAIKTTIAVENSGEIEAEEATAAARGKKKKQPKDTEENGESKVVAKPKGRAKKAAAEADQPSVKASKPRAKKELTPASEEEAQAPRKGRNRIDNAAAIQEPKARARKRKEMSAEANNVLEEAAEPPKRRVKKDAVPEELEPAPKTKAHKGETTAKRARGTKRLADSEIAAALEEADVNEEPPRAASKLSKKEKTVEVTSETVGDSEIVKEVEEKKPKAAVRKRTQKSKGEEPAEDNETKVDAKSNKQRPKKEVKEDLKGPMRKRGRAASADKENGLTKESEPSTETKAARGRKGVTVKTDDVEKEETKPVRSRKKAIKANVPINDAEEATSKTTKTAKKADVKPIVKLDKNAFALPAEKVFNLKICSWNVAGLRAWLKKDGLQLVDLEEPDIFCLQETKCANDQLPEEVTRLPGYHPYWLCMPGGYAGVAIYSKIMPINVEYGIGNEEFDDVGRMITAEYEKFYLINVYVPNSGRKLVNLEPRMRWEKLFQDYVQKLDVLKPVVICGDMNVSHMPIDLENPKNNTKNAGFTQEERDKMTELLGLGFVDTFRHLYPDRKGAYTFWTYMANARARNVGWRLDYCLISERFLPKLVEHEIRSQCTGSDHCPITIFFNF